MRCYRLFLMKYSIIYYFIIIIKFDNFMLRFIGVMCKKEFLCWDNGNDLDEYLLEYIDYDEIFGVQLFKEKYYFFDCKKIFK